MDTTDLTNGLICSLDKDTYALLSPSLTHRSFRQGEVLYEPGDLIDEVYFPHNGVVALLSVLDDGSAVETSTVGRESAVGLLAGLTRLQAFSRIVAQTDGFASSLKASALRSATSRSSRLREIIVRHCDALLATAQQSVACNALHDVEERFSRWLLSCHDRCDGDELNVTQEFLAMMLGVQRTTVTQIAGMLQEAGLIRYQRGKVSLLDRTGLEQRACECYRLVQKHAEAVVPDGPAENGPCSSLSAAEASET